jgi:hypothetical protein
MFLLVLPVRTLGTGHSAESLNANGGSSGVKMTKEELENETN